MTGLAEHTKRICRHLLGKPNEHLSTKDQWRYGAKGSLAIEVAGECRRNVVRPRDKDRRRHARSDLPREGLQQRRGVRLAP